MRFLLSALFLLASCLTAIAQTALPVASQAELIAEFTCPATKCTTTCQGVGGTSLVISAKSLVVYQYTKQPARVWLLADKQSVYVLGEDVSCQFGGNTDVGFNPRPPIPGTPTNPPKPPCTCVGDVCNPPGCRKQ